MTIFLVAVAILAIVGLVGAMIWMARRMQRDTAAEAQRLSDAEYNHISRQTAKGSPDTRLGLPDGHDEYRGG